jgi:hypothetical protein
MTRLISPAQRPIPEVPWQRIWALAMVLALAGFAIWEAYWRGEQFRPSYRNSAGLWAMSRRAVDRQEGSGTIVIGSSRALFDINLETWVRISGERPVQLALEGTNPRPILSHLAQESDFSGLLVVGVTPPLFFMPGTGFRGDALERYRNESPSQWLSQQLSMRLLEPYVASYSFDTALFTVLKRQTWWPARPGFEPPPRDVRKLSNLRATRQADLWEKVDNDPEFASLARSIWTDFLKPPKDPPPPEEADRHRRAVFEEVRENVEILRGRGGEVVFLRCPSTGRFREAEAGGFPRERFWDVLLQEVDAVGVHFEDYPALQDVRIPEWSHISAPDTDRFTTAVMAALRQQLEQRGIRRPELMP